MTDWEHQYIMSNGIRMHYVTAGQGDLVVLLHGFPQFWYAWRHQISALAEHFKVVVPDLRGYGLTDKPDKVSAYASSLLALDIKGLIQALGYKKAHIAGHDWGGAIAWQMALEHPEMIVRLSVLNCPHPAVFAKALKTNYKQMKRSWYIFFFQIPYLPELTFKIFGKTLLKSIMQGSAVRKNTFTEEDMEKYWSALQEPGALTAAFNYYRATFRNMLQSKQKAKGNSRKINSPTLLIWGENDTALGKEMTENMEPYFDPSFNLEIEYIPHCSHWVMEEQPEVVNKLLIHHFKS